MASRAVVSADRAASNLVSAVRENLAAQADPERAIGQQRYQKSALPFREERYAAIALSGERRYAGFQDLAAMELYEKFVVEGAWWDHVDEVAIRRIGPLLRTEPGPVRPIMLAWSTDRDLWRRRASIICQVGAKTATEGGTARRRARVDHADPEIIQP